MERAIFLDRDGTINADKSYINKPEDVKLLPFVKMALKKLQDYGFKLVIVTNQSGIGRGYFNESQLNKIHKRLLELLSKAGINIEKIYFSPYYKASKIKKYRTGRFLRKPDAGMLIKAAKELNIELTASYMIGDKDSDIGSAINAGLKGSVLLHSHYPYKQKEYVPTKKVINILWAANWVINNEKKSRIITDRIKLEKIVNSLKIRNKKVVTTNGVFDILHIGHLRYLQDCKKEGNVLIVGLNSDTSVTKNKGKNRPVVNQYARAEMLVNLKPVDYVFIFSEKDPKDFLTIVKPSVHVKASDYKLDQIIEKKVVEDGGGSIKLANIVKGYSTTNIIRKIFKNEKSK